MHHFIWVFRTGMFYTGETQDMHEYVNCRHGVIEIILKLP